MTEHPILAIGLMSGTSLDGMDAALVHLNRADRSGNRTEYRLLDPSIDPWVAEKFERGHVRALLRHLPPRPRAGCAR